MDITTENSNMIHYNCICFFLRRAAYCSVASTRLNLGFDFGRGLELTTKFALCICSFCSSIAFNQRHKRRCRYVQMFAEKLLTDLKHPP